MKKGIHPENYRLVAFKDMSNDHVFLCRSAVSTKETIEVNGETYPVYKMEISNTSHPFYTGKMKLVDTAGRVDKFMSRYAKRYDKKGAREALSALRDNGLHLCAARLFLVRFVAERAILRSRECLRGGTVLRLRACLAVVGTFLRPGCGYAGEGPAVRPEFSFWGRFFCTRYRFYVYICRRKANNDLNVRKL